MRTSFLLCVALVGILAGGGCAIPVSEHPLSDETTSILDERLIGYWNQTPRDKDEKVPPAPYLISRWKDKPNVLQMTYVELDGEGHCCPGNEPGVFTKLLK